MRAVCTAFCALLAWCAVAPAHTHVYLPITLATTTIGHTR